MKELVLTNHHDLAGIDLLVRGLVASLRQAGYLTLASCQGHAIVPRPALIVTTGAVAIDARCSPWG